MRIDELESELLAEALEGPRTPPLRGGGRGSGRRDPILSRLIWGDCLVLDAAHTTSRGSFEQEGNQIGRAVQLLAALQGSGPWTSPTVRARGWLMNARSFLRPGSQGTALTNLSDAHNLLRVAMRNRRGQLGR